MARATLTKTKSVIRPPTGRATATKLNAAKQRTAPKLAAVTGALGSKDELRARVEKLERANATLRIKNKELRIIAVESAEQVDALTVQLANSERRAGRQARHEASAEAMETGRGKRRLRGRASEGNGHEDHGLNGDNHSAWDVHDHAELA